MFLCHCEIFHHRLIGVVGLKELRKAIEDANSGQVNRTHMHLIKSLQAVNFPLWILEFSCLAFLKLLELDTSFPNFLFPDRFVLLFPGSRDPKAEGC